MAPGFSCPICSENLARLPAEAAQKKKEVPSSYNNDSLNISAAPCGHIFHSYCIQKWLSGTLLSSNKCPCCRKDIPNRACLPLYTTLYEESFLDDTQNGNGNCDHGEELSMLRSKVNSQQEQLKEINQLYATLSDDCARLNENVRSERLVSEAWIMRAKQHESYKDIVKQQEKQIEELQTAMKTFTEIDKILKGNLEDIESDMAAYPPNKQSIRSLLDTKFALTHELKRTSRRLEESRKDSQKFLQEKGLLVNKINKLKKDNQEMSTAFANASFDNNKPSTSREAANQEKRNKVFTKRKGPSPDTSFNGDVVDCDVDLMESPKSKKSYKGNATSTNNPNKTIDVSSDTDDDFMSPLNFRVRSNIAGLPAITPPSRHTKKGYSNRMNLGFVRPK